MKQIFIIRHGQTEWNLQRRMQGRLDSALTHAGAEQAHGHGLLLKKIATIEQMYVSPSGRTRETAYIINSYVRAHLNYEDSLQERDLGGWSGLTVEELEDTFPQAWRSRMDDPYHHRPPEGENLADMSARCAAFLEQLIESPVASVALITHQVMSRVILGRLLGLTEVETVRLIHPNEVLFQLEVGEDMIETCHYVGGAGPIDGLLHQGDDETIPPQNGMTGH